MTTTSGTAAATVRDHLLADGFHFPVDLLEPEEAAALADAVRRHETISRKVGGRIAQRWNSPKIHLLAPWADRLVRDDRVLDVVEALIGPDILVWSTNVFWRRAGSAERLAWHQDALHYGWENVAGTVVRLWLALTGTSHENGTMRFLRGPHNQVLVPHRWGTEPESWAHGLEVDIEVDEAQAVDVELRAGQGSFHRPTTVHSSGPSTATSDRICFAVDYFSPALRQVPRPDSAMVVRGDGAASGFRPETPPSTEFGAESLRGFHEAVALRDQHFLAVTRAARQR
jgi:ectoine hydroxylase-related dioxygenase (phytanoyl-CoA dioxygenase family)